MKKAITIGLEGHNVDADLRILRNAVADAFQRMNGSDASMHSVDADNAYAVRKHVEEFKNWAAPFGAKKQSGLGEHKHRKKGWLGQILDSDIVKTAKEEIMEGLTR